MTRTRLLRLWLSKMDEKFEVQIGAVITLVLSLLWAAFVLWGLWMLVVFVSWVKGNY